MAQPVSEFNPNLYFLAFTREELAEIIEQADLKFETNLTRDANGTLTAIEVDISAEALADHIITELERLSD